MTISASAPLRFVVLLTSVALALLLLLTGPVLARADDVAGSTDAAVVVAPTVRHEVRSGDTLWDIAAGYTLPGDDVRVTIHEIKIANGLESSAIVTGQILVIPVEF